MLYLLNWIEGICTFFLFLFVLRRFYFIRMDSFVFPSFLLLMLSVFCIFVFYIFSNYMHLREGSVGGVLGGMRYVGGGRNACLYVGMWVWVWVSGCRCVLVCIFVGLGWMCVCCVIIDFLNLHTHNTRHPQLTHNLQPPYPQLTPPTPRPSPPHPRLTPRPPP